MARRRKGSLIGHYSVSGRWICAGGRYIKDLGVKRIKATSKTSAKAKARVIFNKKRPSKKLGVGRSCRLRMIVGS